MYIFFLIIIVINNNKKKIDLVHREYLINNHLINQSRIVKKVSFLNCYRKSMFLLLTSPNELLFIKIFFIFLSIFHPPIILYFPHVFN